MSVGLYLDLPSPTEAHFRLESQIHALESKLKEGIGLVEKIPGSILSNSR